MEQLPKHPRSGTRRTLGELRVHAARLQRLFEQGDMLAPFECCALWREAEKSPTTLPDWVIDHLSAVAAEYYETGPVGLDPDARPTPKEYLTMPSRERRKIDPSLDKIAGLGGTQGSKGAWAWRTEHGRDEHLAAVLDHFKARAENGENVYTAPDGTEVPILDRWGRLTDGIRAEVGKRFGVARHGGTDEALAKTVRRRVDHLNSKDK